MIKKISKKGRLQIKEDEATYEKVWNFKIHVCEECGIHLGDDFRDYEGRVNNKAFYSHIITKGSDNSLRDNIKNFNLLCPDHHRMWEYGDRTQMNIYEKNMKRIDLLKSGVFGNEILILLYDFKNTLYAKYARRRAAKILTKIKKSGMEDNDISAVKAIFENSEMDGEIDKLYNSLFKKYK